MKKIKFMLLILSVFMLFTITACGGPTVTQDQVKEDLFNQLKDSYPNIDAIVEMDLKESELTADDDNFIKSRYENVSVAKYDVSFKMTSLSENISGYCSLLYVSIEEQWKIANCYEINSDKWEYVAKDVKPSTKILEDLEDIKFTKFEQGYVGRNDNTEITITSRQTELEKGTDMVNASLVVKTSFSKYTMDINLKYIFEKGKWLLDSYTIADESTWAIEYIDENMPKPVKPETVFMQLTDKSYFLSYCINKDFLSSHTIEQISEDTDTSSVKFTYKLTTVYENIGTFTYTITLPYEWNDQWQAKELDVRITDLDISAMKNAIWTADDDHVIKFSNLESSTANAYTNPDTIVGTYTENNKTQNIKLQVNPSKTDNNWEVTVYIDGAQSDIKCSINLKEKTLLYNDVTFKGTPQKVDATEPSSESSSEPTSEEPTTVPSST